MTAKAASASSITITAKSVDGNISRTCTISIHTHDFTSADSKRSLYVSPTHGTSGHSVHQRCTISGCNKISTAVINTAKYTACSQCQKTDSKGNKFGYPLPYNEISSLYGNRTYQNSAGQWITEFHPAHDYYPLMTRAIDPNNDPAANSRYNGTPIYTIAKGTVIGKGDSGARGDYIVIRHDFNPRPSSNVQYLYTEYQHMNGPSSYSIGDSVSIGDVIGYMGKTGQIGLSPRTPDGGSHLHFETRESNTYNLNNSTWTNASHFNPGEILP